MGTTEPVPNRITPPGERPFYVIDGKEYVRVTHPLGFWVPPYLRTWFIKNSQDAIDKRRNETAQQGSDIHARAEAGTEDRLTGLLKEMGAETVGVEMVVWSKNGWAGRVDRFIRVNGKIYLADIKTGKFGGAFAQLGAYSLAACERGMKVEGMGVLSLPRDESKEARWYDYSAHMESAQVQWCEIFDYWKWDNYKSLAGWEFLPGRSIFSYQWSPEITGDGRPQ